MSQQIIDDTLVQRFYKIYNRLDAVESVIGAIPILSSLPTVPTDGQVIDYLADSSNGMVWRLKYRSASVSAYKWEFVGGTPLYSKVDATEATVATFTTFQSLTTAGPQVTIPLAGDYLVEIGCSCFASSANQDATMSYDIGAVTALDANGVAVGANTAYTITGARLKLITALTAGAALVSKYHSGAASATNFGRRWMTARPVRVG